MRPADYDDIIVTVAHPWADVETSLQTWIETGPGPRPFVTITAARRRNGDPVPLDAICSTATTPKAGGCSGWASFHHRGGRRPPMNPKGRDRA